MAKKLPDEKKADDIIDFAIRNLPLELLGSESKDAIGTGENFQKDCVLESVITFLQNYPKKGVKLVLVGLNRPVNRNRNMTIRVLEKWKKENWSNEITLKLKDLKKN